MSDPNSRSGRTVPLEDALGGVHEVMPQAARDMVRVRVLAAAGSEGRIARARVVFLRSAAAFTATATLLAGTGYAAAGTIPGDLLYPLKRAAEEVQLAFSPDADQGDALLEMTRERAREVGELLESQASEQELLRAADRFGETAGRAVDSQPTPEAEQAAVHEIEQAVSGESSGVQKVVGDEVPTPAPAPTPTPAPDPASGKDPQPQPEPQPNPTPGPGSQPGPGGTGSDSVSPPGR